MNYGNVKNFKTRLHSFLVFLKTQNLGVKDYLSELNEAQQQAVVSSEGPVMVIAGAGSGKTRVLTYRIAHLLKKGVDSFNILALTFTNKAALEMKDRIEKIVGNKEARNLWMGTFHSIFARILRIEGEKLGYPSNFTIYDTDDSKSLIKSILKEQNLDEKTYKSSVVYNRISSAKNNLISWQKYNSDSDIQADDRASGKPKMGLIYEQYQKRCFSSNAMDFDDLLFNMNVLLKNFPDVENKYQHRFKYILVDEYQDTNLSQYLIVKKLAAAHENICIVGDDAQSIYSFRGANIQNILNFKKDYPELKTYKLEQNYRSTKNIVNAANSIISNNRDQLKKDVWTSNDDGDKIKIIRTLTDNEEGNQVANSIFDTKYSRQGRNKDFAILYRTNAQSRAMEESLRRKNIPYKIYGGLSFYKRKEIKDLLGYFRLTINVNDEEALKRIINYPARGIGNSTIEKIGVAASEAGVSFWSVIENPNGYNLGINAGTYTKLQEFITMIKSFKVQLITLNAFNLGSHIATSSGILREFYNDKSPEGLSRYENIQELLNGMKDFSDTPISNDDAEVVDDSLRTLDKYMQDIALLTDDEAENPEDRDKVSLMTIHAAKGLEFPYVYIVGLEENLFPSQMALNSRTELEEERRLFYVAVTRAEKCLTLSYSTSRYKWGNVTHCEPSRFIEEIDPSYLELPHSKNTSSSHIYSDIDSFQDTASYTQKPNNTNKTTATNHPPKPPIEKRNLVKLSKATTINTSDKSPTFEGDDTSKLQIGQHVEHQRFGTGIVSKLEGVFPNQKASVNFTAVGEKQLILKFAKLKILH